MSYIPNCRTDEHYNQKFLSDEYKSIIWGYDAAMKNAESLFYNLDCYQENFDIDGEDINLIRFLKNHPRIKNIFMKVMEDWLETGRNSLITTMIDEMGKDDEIKISFTSKRG